MSDQRREDGDRTGPGGPIAGQGSSEGRAPSEAQAPAIVDDASTQTGREPAQGSTPSGGWVVAGPAPPVQGWTDPGPAVAPRSSAPSVMLAGVILLLFGLLTLAIGLVVLFTGSIIHQLGPAFDQAGVPRIEDAVASIVLVIGALVAIYGALELLAAIGIFARRGWGRALGIVTAALGALFWLVALMGAMAARTVTDQAGGSGLIVALAFLVAYLFSLLALALGGHAFGRTVGPPAMPLGPPR